MAKYKVGDVFLCELEDSVRIFQYVGNDASQLNSNVIVAFKNMIPKGVEFDLGDLNKLDTDFYAHVAIDLGVKMKYWRKIGSALPAEWSNILFRDTNDYGKSGVTESDDWWVWEPNHAARNIGSLKGEYRKSYIGVVMAPPNILDRLKSGKYSYFYPAPKGVEPYWE